MRRLDAAGWRSGGDDGPKLAAMAGLLGSCKLLVIFDDFEQNLTPGGDSVPRPGDR